MDIQKLIDTMNRVGADIRSDYHLTLGQLISTLEAAPADMIVEFDCGGHPGEPDSYRGYYSDLAFPAMMDAATAGDLLTKARAALGATFEGYKGGDYVMGERTPLWKADYGSTGLAIMGADVVDGKLILTTKDVDA